MDNENVALIVAIAVPLAAMLTVIFNFIVKGMEGRYQVWRAKNEDARMLAISNQESVDKAAVREQSSIELATQLLERYSTRLESAYDRERARREASDEEVARLRLEVAALRVIVGELNTRLAQFMGVTAPIIPSPLVISPSKVSEASAIEKREAEVGVKPNVSSIINGPRK